MHVCMVPIPQFRDTMAETLAHLALKNVRTDAFLAMSPKARLDAFAWAYCCTVSEATPEQIKAEAAAIDVPESSLIELKDMQQSEHTKIVAEVLRIFCDRPAGSAQTPVDSLLDEVMGVGGYEGTIPG